MTNFLIMAVAGTGRSGQIKANIYAATGNVAISLHADTIFPDFEIDRIIDVFSTIIRLLVIYLLQRIWGTPDVAGMYKKYYTLN